MLSALKSFRFVILSALLINNIWASPGSDPFQVKSYLTTEFHAKDNRWFPVTTTSSKAPYTTTVTTQCPWWDESTWGVPTLKLEPALELTSPSVPWTGTTIKVDPSKGYQTMLGMGTSLEGSTIYAMCKKPGGGLRSDDEIKKILGLLIDPVNGLGMNLFRITIGTSDFSNGTSVTKNDHGFYTYQDNPTDTFSIQHDIDLNITHVLQLALQVAAETNHPIKFFASSWSPPGWMKTGIQGVNPMDGGSLGAGQAKEYAQYLTNFVKAYQALTPPIPIYAVTTNNEHYFNTSSYPSCTFTTSTEVPLVEALAQDFHQAGLTTKIWILDHNYTDWMENDAIKTLGALKSTQLASLGLAAPDSNADALSLVDSVAYHIYGGPPDTKVQSANHGAYSSVNVQFSEGATWGTSGSDYLVQLFRNGSCSYCSWVTMTTQYPAEEIQGPYNSPGMLSPVLLLNNDLSQDPVPGSPTLIKIPETTKIPEYYLFAQFMKFVQAGAVRIDSDPGSVDTITNVAFQNPDGTIVLVAVNQNTWTEQFRFLLKSAGLGNELTATLPPKSVATYLVNPGLGQSTQPPVSPPNYGPVVPAPNSVGFVEQEYWQMSKFGSDPLSGLKNAQPPFSYPSTPSGAGLTTTVEAHDQFNFLAGTQIFGVLHPPISGSYHLYVLGDSAADLYMNIQVPPTGETQTPQIAVPGTTPNPNLLKKIAHADSYLYNFLSPNPNQIATVSLVGGQSYYFETHQEGGGGNGHSAMAWDIPGIPSTPVQLAGKYLSPSGDFLIWNGTAGQGWGSNGNWTSVATSLPVPYTDGTKLIFDDTASATTVNINGPVSPTRVYFNTSRKNYTVQSTGNGIAGSGSSIYFTGVNTQVTLYGANSYGNGTSIQGAPNNNPTATMVLGDTNPATADKTESPATGGPIASLGTGPITIVHYGVLRLNGQPSPNVSYQIPNQLILDQNGTLFVENSPHAVTGKMYIGYGGGSLVTGSANSSILLQSPVSNDGGIVTIDNTVSPSGGHGIVWFNSATNNISGPIVINGASGNHSGGFLGIGNDTAFTNADIVNFQLASDGISFSCDNPKIDGLYGKGPFTLPNSSLTINGNDNTNIRNTPPTTYLGVLSGTGGLTKVSAHTLTLGGINTYTGPTLVQAGILNVTGSLARSDITVANKASLSLNGGSQNNILVQKGGTATLNGGTLQGNLLISGTLNLTGKIVNNGSLNFTSGAKFSLSSGSSLTNNGVINLLNSGITLPTTGVINNGQVTTLPIQAIQSINILQNHAQITIQGYSGYNYQLQRSTTLAAGSWAAVGNPIPGTDATLTFVDSTPSDSVKKAFYRILITSP